MADVAFTPVTIGGAVLGGPSPLVIAPLMAAEDSTLLARAQAAAGRDVDVFEWRLDFLTCVDEFSGTGAARLAVQLGRRLREIIDPIPLLLTYRTAAQGGNGQRSGTDYADVLTGLVGAGIADAVDVEMTAGPQVLERVREAAREAHIPLVISHHDFQHTPSQSEILECLRTMVEDLHADVAKMAVMPHSPEDVLTLLHATWDARRSFATCPLITIAMGELGVASRIAGHAFGSAATFASVGQDSAPGQLDAEDVRAAVRLIPSH